jgi:acyl-CoA reductase-like NAD-dependent aldehyde dehydrogenase
VVSDHREELAKLEVTNSGHTIGNALWEADNVANVLNYYSASPERLFGKQIPVPNGIDITFKEPLIVPWNFPMPIAGWGFAPALAAGNTVVLKPAEYTPLTAVRLSELALKAGIPEGVFNVIVGKGSVVGNRFVTHPKVRKVVFTGSTEVGKQIMAGCADQVKRVTLELGGKSANIIFADSDIEKAAAAAPGAVFDNAGQDCCARSRLLVEKSVFDKFMAAFETSVKNFKVQDPSLANTDMGPLISKKQLDSVQSYLTESVAFTGSAPSGKGFWMAPTVLLPKDTKAKSWNEEIFGPVVSVLPFDDEADAIRKANDTEFGLSGSIWTNNSGKAIRVARAVESGNLSVNSNSSVRYWTPFGGYKQSGLGRELGPDALDSFTEVKNVFIATDN